MSTEIARYNAPSGITIETVKSQMAPDAPDDELAYFLAECRHRGLDPLAGHAVLIPRWDKRLRRNVYRGQVTVSGRRVIAARTGELAGIEGPVWCGPRVHALDCPGRCRGTGRLQFPDGEVQDCPAQPELVWREVWDADDPPYAARVLVHRRGWVVAATLDLTPEGGAR